MRSIAARARLRRSSAQAVDIESEPVPQEQWVLDQAASGAVDDPEERRIRGRLHDDAIAWRGVGDERGRDSLNDVRRRRRQGGVRPPAAPPACAARTP